MTHTDLTLTIVTDQYRRFLVRDDSTEKSFITLDAANHHAYWRVWFGFTNVSIERL
jgi:hypothetical protein